MKRQIPILLAAAAAAIPAGSAFASSHAAATTKTKTYKGPLVDMRWGPVQAAVTVKGKKVTKVTIVTNPENPRSQFIDEQAVPLLQQETLKAQSANINEVSGATMTSDAFMQSLQAALVKAHLAKSTG
ncbi:MAG TPA: FMN-binding protein [Chloroflexota bacterium]